MRPDRWKRQASLKVITSALRRFSPKIAIAWSAGADSMVLLHLVRSLSGGAVSIPILHVKTGRETPEKVEFIRRVEKTWNLSLIRVLDKATIHQLQATKSRSKRKALAKLLKTRAIKRAIRKYHWKALMDGIRWDEKKEYQSEAYFSPQRKYILVHPLLHFTKDDIQKYILENDVPHCQSDHLEVPPRKQSLIGWLFKVPRKVIHLGKNQKRETEAKP